MTARTSPNRPTPVSAIRKQSISSVTRAALRLAFCSSCGLPATKLPLFSRRLQLSISLSLDLLLAPASMSFGVIQPIALFRRTLL